MRSLAAALLVLVSIEVGRAADERFPVRVLYCGNPGSERESDFRAFLGRHFAQVTTRNLNTFQEDDTHGHDVILFDWTNGYGSRGTIDAAKWGTLGAPLLSRKFSRPALLIGRAGGQVVMPLHLKIDWLCLCLNGPAHHLRLDHPLFHSPLAVDPKLDDFPTPRDYPGLTIDPALGPTMKVWHVQTRNYPKIDPGLVSTLYGFDDSPDAEVIAQGVAAKGPDTVALGRQANFFLWGFSASPADMRPAAQRLFVNVICYMRQFDGCRPLVRSTQRSREWALRSAILPREFSEAARRHDAQQVRALLKRFPESVPKEQRGNLDAFIAAQVGRHLKSLRDEWEREVPLNVRQQFGTDADKCLAYYRNNLEFLQPSGGGFVVDDDVQALGVSNRRVELLDRCVSIWEHGDRAELARRVLTRYTDETFETAAQGRAWLDHNRAKLFFSDVGGYRFIIDTHPQPIRKAS